MDTLFFTGIVGFILGVLFFSFVPFTWVHVVFVLILTGTFFVLWFVQKARIYFVLFLCLGALSLGAFRISLVPNDISVQFQNLYNTSVSLEGEVISSVDVRETSQRITIEIKEGEAHARVLVVAPLYPSVRYGEHIHVEGMFERPESFDVSEGRVFRYDRYLAKDGIFAIVPNGYLEVLASRRGAWAQIFGTLSDVKTGGLSALGRALPEPQASLAGGLILGGKQGLGKELLDDFIVVGLVHIVVLSGYNVMIVAEFVLKFFGVIARRFATIAATISIFMFVLIAGAGSASIRAGIMAGVALFARSTGRTYDAFRALVVAGLLMVVWNPYTLVYDYGFQLSFIATLGLIFGTPLVEKYLSFIKQTLLRELLSATISAQIAVLPLLLYQNGLFSIVALPANVLVLPIVPFAMLASLLALIAGAVVPPLAPVVALPAYILLSYITSVVEILSKLPFASFSVPAFPFVLVIAMYVGLIACVYKKTH
jgi:competence protein ComEC